MPAYRGLTVNSLPNLEVGPAAFGGTFSQVFSQLSQEIFHDFFVGDFLTVLQKFRLLVKYLPF